MSLTFHLCAAVLPKAEAAAIARIDELLEARPWPFDADEQPPHPKFIAFLDELLGEYPPMLYDWMSGNVAESEAAAAEACVWRSEGPDVRNFGPVFGGLDPGYEHLGEIMPFIAELCEKHEIAIYLNEELFQPGKGMVSQMLNGLGLSKAEYAQKRELRKSRL